MFEQFKEELKREPKLRVGRAGGSIIREVSARAGEIFDLADLDCQIRVREFYPHFAMDEKTKQPTNQSDKRLNPAVKVELEADGKTEERWVFGKFPDFKMGEGDTLPFRITLDCPTETQSTAPDFVLITVGRSAHEVWSRYEGVVESKSLLLDQKVKVVPSPYTFQVARFVPAGRLVETYVPTEGKGGAPALQLEVLNDQGRSTSVWVGLNQPRVISTPAGPLTITFAARQASGQGAGPGAHP
ncbi:MAG: hypothetical protein V2A79_10430 [Planctomycetota bacterium]